MDSPTDILAAHLNEGNAIRVVSLCSLYNLNELKNRALDIIADSKKPLRAMAGWDDLEQSQDLKIEIFDHIASK